MSEKVFLKYIKDAFKYDDRLVLKRRNVGARKIDGRFVRFGEPGQADLFGIVSEWQCPYCGRKYKGRTVEMEVKGIDKNGRRGKQSPAQKQWQEEVERNNGIYLLLYPVETDPIGLAARIWQEINQKMCPECFGREGR